MKYIFIPYTNPIPLEALVKPYRKIGNTIGRIPTIFLNNDIPQFRLLAELTLIGPHKDLDRTRTSMETRLQYTFKGFS